MNLGPVSPSLVGEYVIFHPLRKVRPEGLFKVIGIRQDGMYMLDGIGAWWSQKSLLLATPEILARLALEKRNANR